MKYSSREADRRRRSLENAVQRTVVNGERRGFRQADIPSSSRRHGDSRRHRQHHEHATDRHREHSRRKEHSSSRYRKDRDSRGGTKRSSAGGSSSSSSSSSRHTKAFKVVAPKTHVSSPRSSPQLSSSPAGDFAPPLDDRLKLLLHAMAVTREAHEDRLAVLGDLQRTLHPLGLRVAPYGSVATGLLIPSSDLDCVMAIDTEGLLRQRSEGRSGMPARLATMLTNLARANSMSPKERKTCFAGGMRVVANAMRGARMFTNILAIAHAKVPIVKCRHRDVGVKVDLSFEEDGCVSSRFLNTEFQRPGNELARPLIILVKAMIANWGLDDPSVGGLGSFPTSILVLFFLQTEVHARYPQELRGSLGVLLCGLLKYYGFDFDYKHSGIDYVQRCTVAKPASFELFVINPIQPGHNCARAASLYPGRVMPHFQEAYNALHPFLGAESTPTPSRVEAALSRFFTQLAPTPEAWSRLSQSLGRRPLPGQHRWTAEGIYCGGPI